MEFMFQIVKWVNILSSGPLSTLFPITISSSSPFHSYTDSRSPYLPFNSFRIDPMSHKNTKFVSEINAMIQSFCSSLFA